MKKKESQSLLNQVNGSHDEGSWDFLSSEGRNPFLIRSTDLTSVKWWQASGRS